MDWEGRMWTRKKFLAVGKACMAILLTYSKLLRENICQLWVLNRGDVNVYSGSTTLQSGRWEDRWVRLAPRKNTCMCLRWGRWEDKRQSGWLQRKYDRTPACVWDGAGEKTEDNLVGSKENTTGHLPVSEMGQVGRQVEVWLVQGKWCNKTPACVWDEAGGDTGERVAAVLLTLTKAFRTERMGRSIQ